MENYEAANKYWILVFCDDYCSLGGAGYEMVGSYQGQHKVTEYYPVEM